MSKTQALEVVKKHVGAIHIKNDISCLQRKLYNVLLSYAYEELPDPTVHTHSIPVRVLMGLSGFNSKNVGYLKEALENMALTKLTWNIIDEKGKKEWGVATALASATIKEGICSYAYSPHLRPKLYNPEFYAPLNISILSRFSSSHALALYENCVRYKGVRQTPVIDLDVFRDLLGVGDNLSYLQFKVLNSAVIKPAMQEINDVSDITIGEMVMIKEKRKVVAVKFIDIEDKAQAALPMEVPHTFNVDILVKLQEYFCLTEKQAKEVMVTHSEDRIKAVMQYVEKRYTEGKVQQGKIAPYFLRVMKDGDISTAESGFDRAKRETAASKKAASQASVNHTQAREQVKNDLIAERNATVREYYIGQTEEVRADLDARFAAMLEKNQLLFGMWKKNGIKSKAVETAFVNFVANEFLPDFDVALSKRYEELGLDGTT